MHDKSVAVNIVSANAWATHIGRSPRKDNYVPVPRVGEDMAHILRMRAKSASAILGRRHFEIDRQELSSQEILTGIRLRGRPVTIQDKVIQEQLTDKQYTEKEDCRYPRYPLKVRPHTAVHATKLSSARNTNERLLYMNNSLKILSISKGYCLKTSKNEEEAKESDKESNSLLTPTTVNAEKFRRPWSVPLYAFATLEVERNSGLYNNTTTNLPLFWKTRNANSTRLRLKVGQTGPKDKGSKAPQLRSLMRERDQNLCGQTLNCPYKCRGCFKACLASDSYIKKHKQNKQTQ